VHPLKAYLKAAELTESDFATSVGTTPSYLSQIICAKRWPSRALADEIEKATRGLVKAGDLLTWKPAAA
jgi:transcriptional regulator with XRE-family HTH domain